MKWAFSASTIKAKPKTVRNEKFNIEENYSNYGAYIILDFETPDINIIASGSEVEICRGIKKLNEKMLRLELYLCHVAI